MNLFEAHELNKTFRTTAGDLKVLDGLSISVAEGEIVGLFGPNGSGKTTFLNIIAGLDHADERASMRLNLDRKDISFVFQDYRRSLLPWKSVVDNIAFPLLLRGQELKVRREAAARLMGDFGVTLNLNASVGSLSGGQAQLVGILRALIAQPKLLLLDEPFSALDYEANIRLRERLTDFVTRHQLSVLFVSHDLDEALFLADRTLLLSRRPATIVEEVKTELPRPRVIADLTNPNFLKAKTQALKTFAKIISLPWSN